MVVSSLQVAVPVFASPLGTSAVTIFRRVSIPCLSGCNILLLVLLQQSGTSVKVVEALISLRWSQFALPLNQQCLVEPALEKSVEILPSYGGEHLSP